MANLCKNPYEAYKTHNSLAHGDALHAKILQKSQKNLMLACFKTQTLLKIDAMLL